MTPNLPSVQLYAALIAFAFGLLGGIPSLLFFRKSNRLEQILTDFFGAICLILLFLLSAEIGSKGCVFWYTPPLFVLGAVSFVAVSRRFRGFLRSVFLAARRKTGK